MAAIAPATVATLFSTDQCPWDFGKASDFVRLDRTRSHDDMDIQDPVCGSACLFARNLLFTSRGTATPNGLSSVKAIRSILRSHLWSENSPASRSTVTFRRSHAPSAE